MGAIERIGLGLANLHLGATSLLRDAGVAAGSGPLDGPSRAKVPAPTIEDDVSEYEDLDADFHVEARLPDILAEHDEWDFDIPPGTVLRSCRERVPTPYHAPNSEDSWL